MTHRFRIAIPQFRHRRLGMNASTGEHSATNNAIPMIVK
jgi:hypothetical protein